MGKENVAGEQLTKEIKSYERIAEEWGSGEPREGTRTEVEKSRGKATGTGKGDGGSGGL